MVKLGLGRFLVPICQFNTPNYSTFRKYDHERIDFVRLRSLGVNNKFKL